MPNVLFEGSSGYLIRKRTVEHWRVAGRRKGLKLGLGSFERRSSVPDFMLLRKWLLMHMSLASPPAVFLSCSRGKRAGLSRSLGFLLRTLSRRRFKLAHLLI